MKKKESKAGLLRRWLMPNFWYKDLRYKNPPEKGIYWYWFARYVRQRDVEKYGRCISCTRPITFETSQAGHFMPASTCGRDLLFDERNVNAECGPCNAWDETHLLGYAENLDARYGAGTAMELRNRRKAYQDSKTPIKDWSRQEYEEKTKALPSYAQAQAGVLP